LTKTSEPDPRSQDLILKHKKTFDTKYTEPRWRTFFMKLREGIINKGTGSSTRALY